MANFKKAVNTLLSLEFSNPRTFLHKNPGETDYTLGGIYKIAHPHLSVWSIVNAALARNDGNIGDASEELHGSDTVNHLVKEFYKTTFWDKMKLDRVNSDKIATEMFVFGVNAGTKNAVRKAQQIVGVEADGIVGNMTLNALNSYDEDRFDFVFDYVEEQFYNDLIAKKPSFAVFKNGWRNRAYAV